MTRAEFDGWVEEHYSELRAVAFKKYGAQDAEDVLHNAILSLLESQMLAVMPLSLAWPWSVSQMRGRASHLRESQRRAAALTYAVAQEHKRPTMSSAGSEDSERAGARTQIISGDDPLAASIWGEGGERYNARSVENLNNEPLGAPWSRWVASCPVCSGPASLEVVTDREARVFSDGYTTTRHQVAFCINGHRADHKRGTRPNRRGAR